MYLLLGGNPVTDRKGTETVPDSSNEWVERFSHGRIDEVVVYDEQLSEARVDNEYVSKGEYNLTTRELDSSQTFTVSSDEEILESMYTEVGSSVTEQMEAKYKKGSWSDIENQKVETQVKLYDGNRQLVGSYIVTIEPVRLDDGTISCKETHEANVDGSGGDVSYVGGTVTLNSGTFTAEFTDANGNTQTTEMVAADNAPSVSEQNVILGIERPDSIDRSGVTNSGCIYAEN